MTTNEVNTAITNLGKILRVGKDIYTVDPAGHAEVKICTCETISLASWVAFSIAGWHKISLEEREE